MLQYYPSGTILEAGTYWQGKRHGDFISYYENGTVRQVLTFEQGRLVRAPMLYDTQGQLIFPEDVK